MNSIQLTGRLTRDPEVRALPSGQTVANLRLAVDRMGRSNDTGYIDVACFGKPADAVGKHLTQGWLVAVDGRLEYGEWEAQDGTKRSGHSVVGHVEFLAAPRAKGDDVPPSTPPEDDIPF